MNRERFRTRLTLGAILILAAAGAWVSGDLLRSEVNVWGATGARSGILGRLCMATSQLGFDCAANAKSAWSHVKLPVPAIRSGTRLAIETVTVPVAFLGLAYFAAILIWFTIAGDGSGLGFIGRRLPVWSVSLGVAASIFYLALMAAAYAPRCAPCFVVHSINLLLAILVRRLGRRQRASPAVGAEDLYISKDHRPVLRSAITPRALAIVLACIAGLWMHTRDHLAFKRSLAKLRPYKTTVATLRADPDFLLREFFAQPEQQIQPRTGMPASIGRPQLVVFTDFECPSCYCTSRRVDEQISAAFDSAIDVTMRHFPLCNACNTRVRAGGHPNACEAAYAAESARLLGGPSAFRQMSKALYRNRKNLSPNLYRMLAEKIGLNLDDFVEAMNGSAVRTIVHNDLALGRQLGVTGTPSMFLNGRRVPELCNTPFFWEQIAIKLRADERNDPMQPPNSLAVNDAPSADE